MAMLRVLAALEVEAWLRLVASMTQNVSTSQQLHAIIHLRRRLELPMNCLEESLSAQYINLKSMLEKLAFEFASLNTDAFSKLLFFVEQTNIIPVTCVGSVPNKTKIREEV